MQVHIFLGETSYSISLCAKGTRHLLDQLLLIRNVLLGES